MEETAYLAQRLSDVASQTPAAPNRKVSNTKTTLMDSGHWSSSKFSTILNGRKDKSPQIHLRLLFLSNKPWCQKLLEHMMFVLLVLYFFLLSF